LIIAQCPASNIILGGHKTVYWFH